MGKKVAIVDFVHALFKSSVVDICEKGGEYLIGTRGSEEIPYSDGRKVLYTFNIQGLGTTGEILKRLGVDVPPERPYFMEGDKELIADALLKDIKRKHSNWSDFLDDHAVFKKGGKGYVGG